MKKPDAFWIGWASALIYMLGTLTAIQLIHDFILCFMVCTTFAMVLYAVGRQIATKS